VVANFALTWDGRISTRNQTPSDFSSAADKSRLLEIRSEGDAVLASATTVSADTMTMGLPAPALREARVARGQEAFPLRVLWTRSGNLSTGLRLFGATSAPIVVFSEEGMPVQTREALEKVAKVRLAPSGGLSPEWALQMLAQHHGVHKVVLEGGGTLLRLFLANQCVDELCLTWCPRIFGGSMGITLTGLPGDFLPGSVRARLLRMEQTGSECFTRWGLKYQRNFSGKR
jgi:5-amino-6-(5-phosphoribosylamino)uracil reductase